MLGSLLHPDVTWIGQCHNKEQVLDWCSAFQAEGIIATVNSVEVNGNAVVLGLNVSRRADGARPAAPQQLYQVSTIDGAQIVDIRFYQDRASALGGGRIGESSDPPAGAPPTPDASVEGVLDTNSGRQQ